MGWNNPPIPWSELERKLSGRRPAGVRPGDGGDSPAWSRRRTPYEPGDIQASGWPEEWPTATPEEATQFF